MRELEIKFIGRGEVKGFLFTQVLRCGWGYIYRVDSIGYNQEGSEIQLKPYYEVFKHKINKRFDTVSYPSANQFGLSAWSASTLQQAIEIYFKRVFTKKSRL